MLGKLLYPHSYNNRYTRKSLVFLGKKKKKIKTQYLYKRKTIMKKKRGPVTYTKLLEGEIHKEIEGYPNYYITNLGRVLSNRPLGKRLLPSERLREVALSYGSQKYYYCNIYNEFGIRASLRVHRLVYQYFNTTNDCLKEGFVVDHINHDKLDNHINNLRQITPSENSQHYQNYKKELENG